MCLTVKKTVKEQKARTDYLVYKVVKPRDGFWISPYLYFAYTKGKTYTAKLKKYNWGGITVDYHEGLHYFMTKKDAQKKLRTTYMSELYVILECILPKGTTYVEGRWQRLNAGVCTKLKILGEVK